MLEFLEFLKLQWEGTLTKYVMLAAARESLLDQDAPQVKVSW